MPADRTSGQASKAKISSCAECVRLKLKCSRTWPCSSCVKRGCQDLCPNEAMQPRDNLAMQKIIRQLQDEVASLQSALRAAKEGGGSPEHPGSVRSGVPLSDEVAYPTLSSSESPVWIGASDSIPGSCHSSLHEVGVPEEAGGRGIWTQLADDCNLSAAAGPGMGVIVTDGDGGGYLGRGAGALYVWDQDALGIGTRPTSQGPSNTAEAAPDLTFPFLQSDASDLSRLYALWPTEHDARVLLDAYYTRVEWMYAPTNSTALRSALDGIYNAESIAIGLRQTHPHRLATIVLAMGLGDLFQRTPRRRAFQLFSAASALLTTKSAHYLAASSIASIEALHMMVTFLFATGQPSAAKAAWPLLGLCLRLACALGLHRDCGEWGISGPDKAHRDILAWECITYDVLQSLNFGRPYSLPRGAVECPIPSQDATNQDLAPEDLSFHQIKYRLATIFAQIADCVHARVLPAYSTVLAIDKELRQVEADAPQWLRWRDGQEHALPANGNTQKMIPQQHMVGLLLHKGLLALHRPWYTISLSSGTEPLMSPHAVSFTTCVSSARKHTQLMNSLLRLCPDVPRTWWFFPFHAFTAAVIQATILLRQPQCMMSADIKDDFDASFSVMARTAETSAVAKRSMQILSRLNDRIQHVPLTTEPMLPVLDPETLSVSGQTVNHPGSTSTVPSNAVHQADPTYIAELPSDPTSLLMMNRIPAAFDDPVFLAQLDSFEHTLLYWNVNERHP